MFDKILRSTKLAGFDGVQKTIWSFANGSYVFFTFETWKSGRMVNVWYDENRKKWMKRCATLAQQKGKDTIVSFEAVVNM
jgi:hypothetical protein